MSTTTLNEMITEFQTEWEGTDVDLAELVMMMDGAARAFKGYFGKEATANQVIALSKVIAKNKLRTAMAC